jgi:hypothetical protein
MVAVKTHQIPKIFFTAQPKMLCPSAHSLFAGPAQVAHRVSTQLSTALALESAPANHRSVSFAVVAIHLERKI